MPLLTRIFASVTLATFITNPAMAAPTSDDIEAATYSGGDLPPDQTAITAVVQVLLDRAGVSPGVIDGWKGGMSTSAIAAFERREGMAVDGVMDAQVWSALGGDARGAILTSYTITGEDTSAITPDLPEDYAKMAEVEKMGFESVAELLGERFHMDIDFLSALNPGVSFAEGDNVTVVAPAQDLTGEVARIEVAASSQRLTAYDASDVILASYPVAIGSDATPSPDGTHKVEAVAVDPNYTYNPDVNFQQGDNDEKLIVPPGPNGPVGTVWIDLSKPTYGIHGTPDPAKLFVAHSHGCVRMTNWDVMELAGMVGQGVTVDFIE